MRALIHPIVGRIALYSVFTTSVCALLFILILLKNLEYFSENQSPAQVNAPSHLSTDTWGLFDPATGKIITGDNLYVRLPIASVTKLFTAEIVMRSEKKDELFLISESDIVTPGRAGKLVPGKKMSPYMLLFPLLIESSNDAGAAIQRKLGDEFNTSVSSIIQSRALTDTQIVDSTGLSKDNVSTIENLTRFFAYLHTAEPHILDITQLSTYVGLHAGYINNDPARTISNFTGGKHGYTDEAGHTFVGSFVHPDTGREIGIVVLKSTDLLKDIQALLAYSNSSKLK